MKKNNRIFKYILWLAIILSALVFITASYRQVKRIQGSRRFNEFIKEEMDSTSGIEELPKENMESKYLKEENPHKKWIHVNNDYQGWLKVNGTKIDYPVVRGLDNAYYLDRDFFKEKSDAGSIFMDYRNIGNFKDRHTVIYGHHMKNGEMFAGLHKYKEKEFLMENKNISFNSIYDGKDFEIFSAYVDSADDYELKLEFENQREYEKYLENLSELSIYEIDFKANGKKKLITLATCSYEVGNGRLIVHAIEK